MKIIQVNSTDLAGSRFNGYDMQIELNKRGIPCKQFVLNKEGDDYNTILLTREIEDTFLRHLCELYEWDISVRGMVYPYGWRLLKHPEFNNADVVHYHLLHNQVLSYAMLDLLTVAKPSILTIHDPWLFTGHCIHPVECNKWESENCNNCPHISRIFPMKEDNANYMWNLKKSIFSRIDLDIVVSSKWMLDFVKRSPITTNIERVHVIPFGISTELFNCHGKDKIEIRKKLGIPIDDIVLFFRSDSGPFKGVPYINEMLSLLNTVHPITLLTVGEKGLINKGKYSQVENGWVNDNNKIADLYAASDIFLMPSLGESFGLMAIEAMSSGLPVVVTRGTALPDITFAPECGVLIDRDNALEFASVVKRLIECPDERIRRGELGRMYALEHYKIEDHYNRMLELYKNVASREPLPVFEKNDTDFALDREIKHFQRFSLLLYELSEKYCELIDKVPFRVSCKRRFFHSAKKVSEILGVKNIIKNSSLFQTLKNKGTLDKFY